MRIEVTHFSRKPPLGAFSIERVFADIRAAMPGEVAVKEQMNAHFSRGMLQRLQDAWAARRHSSQVNHVTGDVHYLTFFLPKKRTILTIHDTVMIERESGLKRLILWLFWLWVPVHRAGWITAISEESKARILRLVRLDSDRISVIPNPVSPEFAPSEMPESSERFRLVHLGTKVNKNLERVIEALAGLNVELTVIGAMTEQQKALLDQHQLPHRSLERLDDQGIRQEYSRAHALIFVSLDEGFGLPILEAQASGRPVITSAREPMSHVAGDAALLVDPTDDAAIRDAVERLASDRELRLKLRNRGLANVERFSRQAIARAYADLYYEVYAANSGYQG